MNQKVRYFDCVVGVHCGLSVLMNLREQGTDLHVSLALVLQHLQFQRRLCVVVEEVLNELTLEVFQTLFEADRAFIERAQLLVAQGHVVHGQKEDKLVIRVLGSLNLFQHSLCLLQQNQRFLKALLRNEIDGAFVEFIDYDWHLICCKKDNKQVSYERWHAFLSD